MVSAFHPDKKYKFAHGINTPDGKAYYVVLNVSPSEGPTKDGWSVTGDLAVYMLDMAALENGEAKVLQKAIVKGGDAGKTTSFRMYFTPDGKYILQSAANMFMIIDAKTLKLVAKENRQAGDNRRHPHQRIRDLQQTCQYESHDDCAALQPQGKERHEMQ